MQTLEVWSSGDRSKITEQTTFGRASSSMQVSRRTHQLGAITPYDCCAACMCAKSRSVSGLFKIFSNLKRFRADIGGQFRINTVSFNRRTSFSSCVRIFLLRSMRFPVNLWMTWRETVTVAVFCIQPALVTIPVNAMGGMVGKLE